MSRATFSKPLWFLQLHALLLRRAVFEVCILFPKLNRRKLCERYLSRIASKAPNILSSTSSGTGLPLTPNRGQCGPIVLRGKHSCLHRIANGFPLTPEITLPPSSAEPWTRSPRRVREWTHVPGWCLAGAWLAFCSQLACCPHRIQPSRPARPIDACRLASIRMPGIQFWY